MQFRKIAIAAGILFGSIAQAHKRAEYLDAALRARAAVDMRNDRLGQFMHGFEPRETKFLGGIKAGTTKAVGANGQKVVLRRPKGVGQRLRANRTLQVLAEQLGVGSLVPSATETKFNRQVESFPAGETVMAMEYLGKPFVSAERASSDWLGRVPEAARLTAAVIDLLSRHRDRKLANLMVDDQGNLRLIDNDRTFAARRPDRASYRSQFFPGNQLGYRSPQKTFDQLPQHLQELVDFLADAPRDALLQVYGGPGDEVDILKEEARSIRSMGLTQAVETYVATLILKPQR